MTLIAAQIQFNTLFKPLLRSSWKLMYHVHHCVQIISHVGSWGRSVFHVRGGGNLILHFHSNVHFVHLTYSIFPWQRRKTSHQGSLLFDYVVIFYLWDYFNPSATRIFTCHPVRYLGDWGFNIGKNVQIGRALEMRGWAKMKSGWENDKWPPPPLFALAEMGCTFPSCKFHFQGNWPSSGAQMDGITGER